MANSTKKNVGHWKLEYAVFVDVRLINMSTNIFIHLCFEHITNHSCFEKCAKNTNHLFVENKKHFAS